MRRAIELKPEFGLAHFNLSRLAGAQGRFPEAVHHAYQSLLHMPPGSVSPHVVALAHMHNGDHKAAVGVLREWLARDPGNVEAKHVLSALEGSEPPTRAPDRFVESVFDRFAASFDAKLARLEYRAPKLVADAALALVAAGRSDLRILDAGCGTGLCGLELRGRAGWLAGVDLSGKMLAQAAQRSLYDDLAKAELTEHLAAVDDGYDVVVSADTLCYFGALEAVAAAARQALLPGGILVFTVEAAAEEDAPWKLGASGRYSHAESYLRAALDGAGLVLQQIGRDTLRNESGLPVAGFIVAARRPRTDGAVPA